MRLYLFIFILLLSSCDSLFLPEEDPLVSLEDNLSQPVQLSDGLITSSLTDEDIDADALEMLVNNIYNTQPNGQIRSLLISRNNNLVLESYFNGWNINRKQDLRSATKSFTSCLVGIAIDKQIITDEKQKILDFFPDYDSYLNWDERKASMTIEDFLRMRTGLFCNDDVRSSPGNEEKMYDTDDWIKFVLDLPVRSNSGDGFSYCTGAPVTLGAIVSNASSLRIPEFSKTNLFSKLGITDYSWELMPTGRADTGGHLHLRPRDMLKFSLLYLNKGSWNGQQIISEDWVGKSTEMTGFARNLRYGYLWWGITWTINGEEINSFFASGNGGQLIFVTPALEATVVFTGGNYNNNWLPRLLNMMENNILPAFQ